METLGFIIFCIVASGFAGFAALIYAVRRNDLKTRVASQLLVTDIETYKDDEGDTYYKAQYLVLDGVHAGAKAKSTMGSNPAFHEKHEYVDGWFNPADGTAISNREAGWEKYIPLYLLGLSAATFALGLLVT